MRRSVEISGKLCYNISCGREAVGFFVPFPPCRVKMRRFSARNGGYPLCQRNKFIYYFSEVINPMANKYVYLFSEGNANMRELLGGKGANLAEMTNIGLPVPQGFTITTEACTRCLGLTG